MNFNGYDSRSLVTAEICNCHLDYIRIRFRAANYFVCGAARCTVGLVSLQLVLIADLPFPGRGIVTCAGNCNLYAIYIKGDIFAGGQNSFASGQAAHFIKTHHVAIGIFKLEYGTASTLSMHIEDYRSGAAKIMLDMLAGAVCQRTFISYYGAVACFYIGRMIAWLVWIIPWIFGIFWV